MKCVKHVDLDVADRVTNDKARKLVGTGYYRYVPKSVWKAEIRKLKGGK